MLLGGASGLIGRELLQALLADPQVAVVHSLGRRPLALEHPKLVQHVVDFAALPVLPALDEAYVALGTTIKQAGSQAAFRAVDFDAVVNTARAAHTAGARRLGIVSAMGADAASRVFYNRVKGDLERDLEQVGFASLTHARPGLIGGERAESRPAERAMILALGTVEPLLPRRWRLNPPQNIAQAMIEAALEARPGVHVIPSTDMAQ